MRSNREKDLEAIINEMYTHKIEIPANNTVEEDETSDSDTADESSCNTHREGTKYDTKCPHCGEKIVNEVHCS